MNNKIRVTICFTLILASCFFTAFSEKSFEEIINMQLDEEVVNTIKVEAKLPNDYDVNRAIKGMEYLVIFEEFSIPGAAGLIGNGFAESRLLLNPGKGFYKGLFQWDGKIRWPRVKEFLEENKVDFENEEELYFWELVAAVNSEDGHIYQEVIDFCKDSSSAKESADKWCRKFEGVTQALSTRKRVAELSVTAFEVYLNITNEPAKIDLNNEIYLNSLPIRNVLKQEGFDEEYQLAELFYDLLENSEITYYEIAKSSNIKVAEAVRIIKNKSGYSKKEYFNRIKQNDISRMVVLANRIDALRNIKMIPKKARKLFLKETEDYYIDLAKGTAFEERLNDILNLKKQWNSIAFFHII